MDTTKAALLLAAPALLALAGCRSGYDVDVRNLTDQPISARLNVPFGDGAPRTLVERYVGPGERQNMFIQTDWGVHVSLAADFQGNVGYPAVMDLSRGQTIVNVRRADDGTRGKLRLEEVPRP
jgi:hypothetical protein